MKKTGVVLTVILLSFIVISSCSKKLTPTQPSNNIYSNANIAVCIPGDVAYTGSDNMVCTGPVINTQAEFDAAYCGWAPAGTPTPTPEAIDFTKKTLIVMRLSRDCGTGASFAGITTDCTAIYLNIHRTSDCSWVHCNSTSSFLMNFLIDKTSLPIKVKTKTVLCDDSVVTDISALQ